MSESIDPLRAASPRRLGRVGFVLLGMAAALVLFSSAPARAQDDQNARETDWSRWGPYVSVAGVIATDLYESDLEDAIENALNSNGVGIDIEQTGGVNARAGVRFAKVLALEIQYEYLAEYDIDVSVTGLGDIGRVKVEQQTLTANLRLNAPIGRFQPYVLAGVGFQKIETDARAQLGLLTIREKDDDIVMAGRLGAGIEIYVTRNVGIFGEGLFVVSDEEVNVGGENVRPIFYAGGAVGLTYRF